METQNIPKQDPTRKTRKKNNESNLTKKLVEKTGRKLSNLMEIKQSISWVNFEKKKKKKAT